MERRDILKLGAAAALTGCATSRGPTAFRAVPPPPVWSPGEVDEALADMDATLAKLAAAKPRPDLFGVPTTLDNARVARGHDLTMRTLAAMHVAATFRELPADVQQRPDVQRRMWNALPFLDDAMLDMSEYLSSLAPSERRAVQQQLRKDPSLGMQIVGKLDEHAASAGVPNRRRAQMRAIATHATWRITRQSVDALVDDTLSKVQRVRERHGRDEQLQRAVGAKVAEAELFGAQGPSHLVFSTAISDPHHRKPHRSAKVLGVGGILLGVGAVFGGLGAALVVSDHNTSGAWFAGAISITVGSLLGLAGIIVLIVGAAMAANESNEPDETDTSAPPAQPPPPPEADEGD